MASEVQQARVERVLGVGSGRASGSGAPAASPEFAAAVAAWQDAQSRADSQIAALQAVLRASPDKDLQEIAEFGLNALTANHRVRIQAALMDLRGGGASAAKASAAAKLVTSLMDYIDSEERIAVCDTNPFGVRMNLHGTLTPPLGKLRAALQAMV